MSPPTSPTAIRRAPAVTVRSAPVMPETSARAYNAGLTTERLVLEPLTVAHADALFPLLQSPEIYTWISALPPTRVEALRARYAQKESRRSPDGDEAWLNWVVRRTADRLVVGLVDAVIDAHEVATNIGYIFFPGYWGQGYATESVRGVAEHLLGLGVSELRATVTMGNEASVRVLTRAGFRRTRVLPDNDRIRGEAIDDLEFVRQGAARS